MAPTAVCSRPVDQGYQPSSRCESTSTSKQSSAASKSSSTRSHHPQDRFYGHREMSELCERFILYLFACPLDSTSASVSSPSSSGMPAPRLSEFIAYALYRTRLPEAVTYQALYLLLRLKIRFPAARGSSGHRLFISALMLASKSSCDDTYSNKSWTIVGQGLFSLREVNQMERELFGYLGYKVNVEPRELELFTFELEQGCDVGRFDHVVRRILDLMSRRTSLDLGANEVPCSDRSESFTAAPLPQHVPSLDAADISSPASDSNAGPHRIPSGRHSRQSSSSQTFNTRASISGYTASQISHSHTAPQGVVSKSVPASVGMAKSASYRHERTSTAAPPTFTHPFVNNARDRCRPYTMPTHPMQLSSSTGSISAAGERPYYSNSPTASISSSSVCSTMSYAPSSSSGISATPSPCASRSTISGRTTPDTPVSDVESSQWEDACYYGSASVDPKEGLSPVSSVDPAQKYYEHHPSSAQQYYTMTNGHSAAESYLHPYNCWRS